MSEPNRVRYFSRVLDGQQPDGWTEIHREHIPSLKEAVCVVEKDMSPTVKRAVEFLSEIADLLQRKNVSYGDSAANPLRVFSKADPVEQIKVRIDDKLSRIAKGDSLLERDDDVIRDLIGYLALLEARTKRKEL